MSRIWFCGQRNYDHVLRLYILYCLKIIVRYVRFVFTFINDYILLEKEEEEKAQVIRGKF